jgi:anti-sigma factor RsiW
MSRVPAIPARDLEALSAYLDGRLSPSEAATLEQRLDREAVLRGELEGMRQTVRALKSLPSRRVPRSFALKPEAIAKPAPARWYPVFQLGTALAGIAFALVVGADVLGGTEFGLATRSVVAEAPVAQPEAGAASLFAETGTATPAGTALPSADMLTAQATAPAPLESELPMLGASKASATATPSPTEAAEALRVGPSEATPLLTWPRAAEIVLGLLTVALAAITLRLRRRAMP